jgi:hypothetical protein
MVFYFNMILRFFAICVCCFFATLSLCSAIEKANSQYKLSLNNHPLTTNTGILLPTEIIKSQADTEITINMLDGTVFRGTITKAAFKEKYHFECFGEIHNHPNTGFGFVVTDKGVYGALVMRDTDITYVVTFSPEANGYVLSKRITPTIQL